jgi:hypothetical protein
MGSQPTLTNTKTGEGEKEGGRTEGHQNDRSGQWLEIRWCPEKKRKKVVSGRRKGTKERREGKREMSITPCPVFFARRLWLATVDETAAR